MVETGTLPLDAIGRPASFTGKRCGRCGGVDLCSGGWDRGNGDVQRNGEGGVEAIKRCYRNDWIALDNMLRSTWL